MHWIRGECSDTSITIRTVPQINLGEGLGIFDVPFAKSVTQFRCFLSRQLGFSMHSSSQIPAMVSAECFSWSECVYQCYFKLFLLSLQRLGLTEFSWEEGWVLPFFFLSICAECCFEWLKSQVLILKSPAHRGWIRTWLMRYSTSGFPDAQQSAFQFERGFSPDD